MWGRGMRSTIGIALCGSVVVGLLGGAISGVVGSPRVATAADSVAAFYHPDGMVLAHDLAPDDSAIQKVTGPVSEIGWVDDSIVQVIDPAVTQVRAKSLNGSIAPDVTAPQGWPVEYFDGTSWSGTPPAYDAVTGTYPAITSVRTGGPVDSAGFTNGVQSSRKSVQGALEASVGNINVSTGGDGWDVFFGGGRIFNIFHHDDAAVRLRCFTRDGNRCWANDLNMTGYTSSPRSTGFYDSANHRVYSFSIRHSDDSLGLVCIKHANTSQASPCDIPFIAFGAAGGRNYGWLGDAVRIGDKIYMRGSQTNQPLFCFDVASGSKCGVTGAVTGALSGSNAVWQDNRLLAVGTKVFVSTGTQLACFDDSTMAMCAGFGNGGAITATTLRSLFYTTNEVGTPTQVCAYSSGACWDIGTGTTGTWPAGFTAAQGRSIGAGWGAATNLGTQLFYYTDNDHVACFDFATGTSCAGFAGAHMGSYPYAVSLDPTNSRCLWSNSDGGNVRSFIRDTGATPCTLNDMLLIPSMPATHIMSRLGCSEGDRLTSWGSLRVVSRAGATSTSATVTVRDSAGNEIAGWIGRSVALSADGDRRSGTLDLSSLTVAETGATPRFAVTYAGETNATGGYGIFTAGQAPPALCVGVQVQPITVNCPTGLGDGSGDFPYRGVPLSFTGSVTLTPNGGSPALENSSATATRVISKIASDCLATLTGTAYRGATANPLPNATVSLLGPTGDAVLATTTTDATGQYTFANVYPNTYRARIQSTTSSDVNVATPGSSTSFADLMLPVTVASVTSNSGPTAGGTAVTVTGSGFAAGATVDFGGSACAPVTVASSTSLTCTTTSHAAGAVTVTVTNANGLWGSLEAGFSYIAPPVPGPGPAPLPSPSPTPSSTPTPTPTSSPTPSPTASPSQTPTQAPSATPSPVPLPAPLEPGQALLLVDGAPVPVDVEPSADNDGLRVQGDGWTMDLHGLDSDRQPLILGPGGVLELQADRQARTTGSGFLANSAVALYLNPPAAESSGSRRAARTGLLLGTIGVDAQGRFDGVRPLPPDVDPGVHTLQAVGFGPAGQTRALNLPVAVRAWIRLDPGPRRKAGIHDRLRATGMTGGIPIGARLKVRIKVHNDSSERDGVAMVKVRPDRSFSWTRLIRTFKPITVRMIYGEVGSNRETWKSIRPRN